jgi:hypothetical protein
LGSDWKKMSEYSSSLANRLKGFFMKIKSRSTLRIPIPMLTTCLQYTPPFIATFLETGICLQLGYVGFTYIKYDRHDCLMFEAKHGM